MNEKDFSREEGVIYPAPLNEQEQAVLSVFVDAVTIRDSRLRNLLVDTLYEASSTQLEYDRERIDFIYSKALLVTERELVDEDTARLEEATADLPSHHELESEQAGYREHFLGRSAIGGAK